MLIVTVVITTFEVIIIITVATKRDDCLLYSHKLSCLAEIWT
jgi:hypothetical protein